MLDARGIPLWLLLVMLVAVPCVIGLVFGSLTLKHVTPSLFHCKRCDRDFQRKAWRRFPRVCGHCGAPDWNTWP